jgi:hypothetical protein
LNEEDFIKQALDRFQLAAEAEAELRRDALNDFQFLTGEQWDNQNVDSRTRDGRPCLTMNRLRSFRRMVTNEQRQQRPSIQINPVGDGSDVETAEVIQGLCRHIEVNSDAEIAYDTGFENMATGGFGFWRVVTEYVDDDSDEQDIFIKRVRNAFSVYFDPRAQEPDYADALWCFIVEDIPTEVYREEYGDKELAALEDFHSTGDRSAEWITRETIRVAEYFYVELEKNKKGRNPRKKVKWAKINAVKILDQRDVPCKFIPVVPVLGDDTIIDGKRNLVGMIRDAKDPQRFYNYQISAAAEAIALAPKAPWTAAEGQLEGHESEWEQSNRRNLAVLTYKPLSSANGAPMPRPERNVSEPPIQAMALMIRQADNDLKAITGIYDASLGQQGPEQSGKAVLLRQKQSDIANLNYTDNLARSIRHTGRILLSMIPQVYDVPQVRRIIDTEEKPRMVAAFNSQTQTEPEQDELTEMGVEKVYDLGLGRYDVTVSVGPSYQSKRQEAVASQMALISNYPQIMPIAGDLLVRNMDIPGATKIADRMQKMLPPQLQEQAGDPAGQLQQLQGHAAQLAQQNQVLVQALQHSQQIISQKLVENQSRENTALIDAMTKINVAKITASKDQDTAAADRELEMLGMAHDSAHEVASQQMDQTHEAAMQQMQQPPQGNQPGTQPAAQPPQGPQPSAPAPPLPGGPTPPAGPPGQGGG